MKEIEIDLVLNGKLYYSYRSYVKPEKGDSIMMSEYSIFEVIGRIFGVNRNDKAILLIK